LDNTLKLRIENVKWKISDEQMVQNDKKPCCPNLFKIAAKQHSLIFNFPFDRG